MDRDDTDRGRIDRGARDRNTPPILDPSGRAFLAQVVTPQSAGKFMKVKPVVVTGLETEGGAATLTASSSPTYLPYLVGNTPSAGDYMIATAVRHRWEVRMRGYPPVLCQPCRIPGVDVLNLDISCNPSPGATATYCPLASTTMTRVAGTILYKDTGLATQTAGLNGGYWATDCLHIASDFATCTGIPGLAAADFSFDAKFIFFCNPTGFLTFAGTDLVVTRTSCSDFPKQVPYVGCTGFVRSTTTCTPLSSLFTCSEITVNYFRFLITEP